MRAWGLIRRAGRRARGPHPVVVPLAAAHARALLMPRLQRRAHAGRVEHELHQVAERGQALARRQRVVGPARQRGHPRPPLLAPRLRPAMLGQAPAQPTRCTQGGSPSSLRHAPELPACKLGPASDHCSPEQGNAEVGMHASARPRQAL